MGGGEGQGREEVDELLREVALKVERRIEREVEKRLGRKAQYVVAISVKRGAGGVELGIDLQLFSPAGSGEKLEEIADEVVEAGLREADEHFEKAGRRDRGALEEEKDSYSITPIG